jgi:hypothetical protein
MYKQCHIEEQNGFWYIMWPDCTRAWKKGYKNRAGAAKTLNYLNK